MAPSVENVRRALTHERGGRPVCLACGRTIAPREDRIRMRGGTLAHRACATYTRRNGSG